MTNTNYFNKSTANTFVNKSLPTEYKDKYGH